MNYRKILTKFVMYEIMILAALYFIAIAIKITLTEYLWVFTIFMVIYLPMAFILSSRKRAVEEEEEEKIIVGNDIAHFKEVVNKALKGNAVAQRDVEMHIINAAAVDLHIRYGIPDKIIRARLSNPDFLEKYMGSAGRTLSAMFERRHDLKLSIPDKKFKKEIEEIMEAIK